MIHAKEGFAVISGKISEDLADTLGTITSIAESRYSGITKARHDWVDKLDDSKFKELIDTVRTDNSILDGVKNKFPKMEIRPVTDIDEIYWAVSADDATGSDRALVDCHYDGPFKYVPTGGVIVYRVLVACNENTHTTTRFPGDNITVKMNTSDYHGFDYDMDGHCVDGKIPPGKHRVILKLHYLVVPQGSDKWANFTLSIHRWWAVYHEIQ